MTANMKPIDAIRNKMLEQGYDIDIDINRRDICDLLGVSRKSSTRRLCYHLGVKYNSNCIENPRKPPRSLYLIDINDLSNVIEFNSMCKLSNELLIVYGSNSSFLEGYISNQYVIRYHGGQYVISDTPQRELTPNFNSPYMMVTIRQELRSRGYPITIKTNRKDVCRMLGLSSVKTKLDICDELGSPYVKRSRGGKQRWRRVKLTNPYNPSHTVEFRSIAEAGRKLNIQSHNLYTYIRNQSLTVPYEGYVFNVSFTE